MRSSLSRLCHWLLHGGSFKLRTYERLCLQSWRALLSPAGQEILDLQLKRLTHYQRQANEKLLCFYDPIDDVARHWPASMLFPCRLEEARVARLWLRATGDDAQPVIKTEVVLSGGRFFGFEFNRSPRPLRYGADLYRTAVLLDPMSHSESGKLLDDDQQRILESIDAKLPADYLSLLADAGHGSCNGWTILDPARIRKVPGPKHNYYVLAEKEGRGAVGVAQDDPSGELIHLDCEEDTATNVGKSLRAFIEQTPS